MLEFDYKLDYKKLNFKDPQIRKLYRIGRGEQGVLLVRPYTDFICRFWRFKSLPEAELSAKRIHEIYMWYRMKKDFIGMDMCRKFLEMGFTRARRYANHKDGNKYDENGNVKPQEKDWATSEKAQAAKIHKRYRDLITHDKIYVQMRKNWRELENVWWI